jgi:hypothetical protein
MLYTHMGNPGQTIPASKVRAHRKEVCTGCAWGLGMGQRRGGRRRWRTRWRGVILYGKDRRWRRREVELGSYRECLGRWRSHLMQLPLVGCLFMDTREAVFCVVPSSLTRQLGRRLQLPPHHLHKDPDWNFQFVNHGYSVYKFGQSSM